MYKLIFVEDEAIVMVGISFCIPWGQNGFELAGLFENGLQTLEYMRDHPVLLSPISIHKGLVAIGFDAGVEQKSAVRNK